MTYNHHKCKCSKCGRKILVEIILFGVSHNASISATCAECLGVVSEDFKKDNPGIAEGIQKWIDETRYDMEQEGSGDAV